MNTRKSKVVSSVVAQKRYIHPGTPRIIGKGKEEAERANELQSG